MKPSEIRKLKEDFSRALFLSILLVILTNMLSLFWVIGGEAWFEDSYSAPSFYDLDERTRRSIVDIPTSEGGKPKSASFQETYFQPIVKESEEYGNSKPVENIFQYIIESIKKFFKSIFEDFF
ncbi:MAG: hypothetical protein QXR44_03810 [Thermoproteota archaeon]